MKRFKVLAVVCGATFILAACGGTKQSDVVRTSGSSEQQKVESTEKNEEKHEPVTIKTSPDKYTWYIKDYIGKNIASFGYTSMGGDRMDSYGDGYLKLVFVNGNGSYIDISNEDELKKYMVIAQNIKPNTEMKYVFQKDEAGEEYDNLIDSQTIEQIILAVKEVGSSDTDNITLTEINVSPDKYTRYVRDYVGRNLASCGYLSMAGDFRDAYGAASVKLVIMADDGSYVDVSDEEALKKYRVTGQNIAPNTEIKLEFFKDENEQEYENLVDSQSIEEIELNISLLEE